LIQRSQQLSYSISKILDPETLLEGKILELINRRIGDITIMEGDRVVLQPEHLVTRSYHELEPGVYKIEFATVPVLASYFTLDRQQELTIGLVRSGYGLDLYDRVHLALGNKYYDNGQIEEALMEYQKVIEFDPRNVDAHLNLGIIYDDLLKDKEKAAEHYRTYLELQGPRQDEVREWLRKVRGEPTREEEIEEKAREREEEEARKEAERLAEEEKARAEAEYQEALKSYNEILTANPEILEEKLSEEEVFSGDVIHVTVSDVSETTDSEAQEIALDVGERIKKLLKRTPNEVIVYRESKPDVPIAHARYDVSQQQYVIITP
jgi:tetratricopeptide (TPR) repeat protein